MFVIGKAIADTEHWWKSRYFHVAQTISIFGIVLFGIGCWQAYDHWLYTFVVIMFGMGAPFEMLLSYLNTGRLYGGRTRTFPIEFLPERIINWIGEYVAVEDYQIRFNGMAAIAWDVSRVVLVVILCIEGNRLL